MTTEDVLQELQREPYTPLRFHLSSGQVIEAPYPNSVFVRQNTILIMHRLAPGTQAIGNYDVVALRLIERIELMDEPGKAAPRRRKRA